MKYLLVYIVLMMGYVSLTQAFSGGDIVHQSKDIVIKPKMMRLLVNESTSYAQLKHEVRLHIIRQLIGYGFTGFVVQPYRDGNGKITLSGDHYMMEKSIIVNDDLDLYLDRSMRTTYMRLPSTWKERKQLIVTGMVLSQSGYQSFRPIYLFVRTGDLQELGYEVVSYRHRTNKDTEYRRYNILTAFNFLGGVRVLNPSDSINFLNDINYDSIQQVNYRKGKGIVADEEIPVYGGGICGASTALYQGTVTNKGLIIKSRNHSRRYTSLYEATINGKPIAIPGVDSTVYEGSVDLTITNNRSYPIIIITNYDGTYGGTEEVFTLARPQDRGYIRYLDQSSRTFKNAQGKAIIIQCYRRDINGVLTSRCYKKVQ